MGAAIGGATGVIAGVATIPPPYGYYGYPGYYRYAGNYRHYPYYYHHHYYRDQVWRHDSWYYY